MTTVVRTTLFWLGVGLLSVGGGVILGAPDEATSPIVTPRVLFFAKLLLFQGVVLLGLWAVLRRRSESEESKGRRSRSNERF